MLTSLSVYTLLCVTVSCQCIAARFNADQPIYTLLCVTVSCQCITGSMLALADSLVTGIELIAYLLSAM